LHIVREKEVFYMVEGFIKEIPSQISEYKIFDVDSQDELIKVASDIDFPEGFMYDPDFLYMWVRIVSAGEAYGPNKNGDYFPEDELVSYWETFNEAHPFKNHVNKNVEDAIGKIVTVRWNPIMKCVEILKGIDKKRAPEIVRGFQKGYLTDVSMGCKVPYTQCSICGNKARKRSEFCEHVKYHRLQFLGNGERVFEINFKPRFHDSSTVLNGAERVAKAFFIFNEKPANYIEPAFRKAASSNGAFHYIKVSDYEMEKVAEARNAMHPLLKEENLEKVASETPMMKKIAELEKQLTGKLLNVATSPKKNMPAMKQMLEVIKFLTDKRMDEKSLKNIASSVKTVAKENGVPVSRAFATLIGVAELMGIELFPSELHTLLCGLTDAKLDKDFISGASGSEPVYPGDYAKGIEKAVICVKGSKDFDDPSSLLSMYDEAAHHKEDFMRDPLSFLSSIKDGYEMDSQPTVRMVKVIRNTLNPVATLRSHSAEHLLPRLSIVLAGHRPLIGDGEVRKDLEMLMDPVSPGDVLGRLAYNAYENMRPKMMGTRLIKLASEMESGFEKSAIMLVPPEQRKKKLGIGVGKAALLAVPAAYGASAFQKSRRENDRHLTDAQNFVADKPGIIAGGAILAGVPLSRAVHKAGKATASGARKAGKATASAVEKGVDALKAPFTKMADNQLFEGLVKIADSLSTGAFNVFDDNEVLKRYMYESGASGEETSAVKMATLLNFGDMDKTAFEIMDHYNISNEEICRFLKIATDYVSEEMDKAAEDFTNNMILSAIGDTNPLARTLPGRAVDAFIFKKLGDLGKSKEPKVDSNPEQPQV
jgi:hypothetical protein